MTRRKAWRYKCDHCGKTGSSGGHIKRHEERCSLNPERTCGMCALLQDEDNIGRAVEVDTQKLVQIALNLSREQQGILYIPDADLSVLREAAKDCPACMLAAIRQAHTRCALFCYKHEAKKMLATVGERDIFAKTYERVEAPLNDPARALARQFHDTYERLAPSFGYETRPETRNFDPDSANGRLMVAVCKEIMGENDRRDRSNEG